MEQGEFLSVGKVAKRLGVSSQIIPQGQKDGKVQELRSPTNRRPDSVREVERIMRIRHTGNVVILTGFALHHGAQVIMFDYLQNHQAPKEMMSRSGRKSHKRDCWLRCQIVK
jgi:hypothetical protein